MKPLAALCLIVSAMAGAVLAGELTARRAPDGCGTPADRIAAAEYVANAADGNKIGVLVRALEVSGAMP
jgi:hypothetical protein